MTSSNNEWVVFVPACLLCPTFLAKKAEAKLSWRQDILSYFVENGYSIVQMPCPESTFAHDCCGLNRTPHGVRFYESLPGFDRHCQNLSKQVFEQISAFYGSGYKVLAILGIEHSPTCAVTYMYTNQGTVKRQGIFMEALSALLAENQISIPVVGINRRFPNSFIKKLESLRQTKEPVECGGN